MGFFGRILCALEKEGKVTDFPYSLFQMLSVCGMLGKTLQGLWKGMNDSSHSCWKGKIPRVTNSSTKCQMRKKCCRLAEDHGKQRRLPGGGVLEVSFEVKLCRE